MKKIFIAITAFILSLATASFPVMATSGPSSFGVEAIVLTGCAGEADKKGGEILCILKLVVDILSIGVGVLGVAGISVVGIQYLTAGGSEEKTRKAKRRMFEIIIGLVAYAVIYVLLQFLLPNFPN